MNPVQEAEYRASIARMKATAAHQRLIEAAKSGTAHKRPGTLATVAAKPKRREERPWRWRCYWCGCESDVPVCGGCQDIPDQWAQAR